MSPCIREIAARCDLSASKSLRGNEASSLLSSGLVEGACNCAAFPPDRNGRHNRSLMDARSERAPRECLILGSAQTLVGPVSVFGPIVRSMRPDIDGVAHPGSPVRFIRSDCSMCTICDIGQISVFADHARANRLFQTSDLSFCGIYRNKAPPCLLAREHRLCSVSDIGTG